MARTPKNWTLPYAMAEMERRIYALERRLATATASAVQVGDMVFSVSGADRPGWLICDGRSFDPAIYPELQAFLGGTTTPNMTDRVPIGAGTKAAGSTGGSAKIGVGQLPAHGHAMGHDHADTGTDSPTHTHDMSVRYLNTTTTGGTSTRVTNVGAATPGEGTYVQATTGTQNRGHTHNVPGSSRTSTGKQGSGNDYWQPYRAGYWLIYAGAALGSEQYEAQQHPPDPAYPPGTVTENEQATVPEYLEPETQPAELSEEET